MYACFGSISSRRKEDIFDDLLWNMAITKMKQNTGDNQINAAIGETVIIVLINATHLKDPKQPRAGNATLRLGASRL